MGKSVSQRVTAIERSSAETVVSLSVSIPFRPDRAALIFDGHDVLSFVPNPDDFYERCVVCGVTLRDAFDRIDLEVRGEFTPATHFLVMHAACLNDTLGRNSKLDVFEYMDEQPPSEDGAGSPDADLTPSNWPDVVGRVVESAGLLMGTYRDLTLQSIDVAANATLVALLARYRITDAEFTLLLEA